MITLDRSDRSTLAVCSCGWRALAHDWIEGRALAADHENRCHPGEDHAGALNRQAQATRRRRR